MTDTTQPREQAASPYPYDALFRAIGDAVNIVPTDALSISVKQFVDTLAAQGYRIAPVAAPEAPTPGTLAHDRIPGMSPMSPLVPEVAASEQQATAEETHEVAYAQSGYRHFMDFPTFKAFRADCGTPAATTASASERDTTLEEAAKICDQARQDAFDGSSAKLAAESIRALKGRATAPSRNSAPLYSPKMYQRIVDILGPLMLGGATIADDIQVLAGRYHEAMAARRALAFEPDAEVTPEEIERTIVGVYDLMKASRAALTQQSAAQAPIRDAAPEVSTLQNWLDIIHDDELTPGDRLQRISSRIQAIIEVSSVRAAERIAAYVPGQWFDAQTLDEMQEFYLSRLPAIREAAKKHGYAIGLHGSERRDFDLMAMQWRADASPKDTLAHAIAVAACGITCQGTYPWESKPNGRFAVSLPICWTDHGNPEFGDKPSLGHIDLSVIDPIWMILFIEKRAEDYAHENASTDEDTGATVWHFGEAGREYHSMLADLADDLRAAMSAATEQGEKPC